MGVIKVFTDLSDDLAKPPVRVQRIERIVDGVAGIGDMLGGDFARSRWTIKGAAILEKTGGG